MGFETASRGLMINQKALDIVANNVGNIGVTGYTRQRVDQVSLALSYRNTRYYTKNSLAGQGATIAGISQMRDSFLDKRFREEYGDVGYYDTTSQVLEDLSAALDEIEPEQMNVALDKLRDAWGQVQKDGGSSEVAASGILAASKTVVQVLQQLDAKLKNVWEQQKHDLSVNVDNVNVLLQQVANLNDAIKKECSALDYSNNGYYGPNELMDQRNVILDTLAGYGNIVVKAKEDGTVDVTMNGHLAVTDTQFDRLNLDTNHTGNTVSLIWNSTGNGLDLTGNSSGSLKASMEMLNGRGDQAHGGRGELSHNGILFYQDKIDVLATTLAEAFNSFIPVADADGNHKKDAAGNLMYKQLFTFTEGEKEGAGSIKVNPTWVGDTSYIFDDIVRDGMEDSDYAAIAQTFFDEKQSTLQFGEFTGSFSNYVTYYTTTLLGSQKEDSDSRLESSSDITDNLMQRIASVSGVSLNEEASDQMMYQKAYSAMSRVMTALDDLLDQLINRTGRVGL